MVQNIYIKKVNSDQLWQVCFVPVPKNTYARSESMYVMRIPRLVTIHIMKWFGEKRRGSLVDMTWWWVYVRTKVLNQFTFSHQFHIHHFCLWLHWQRTAEVPLVSYTNTTTITPLPPPATTYTQKTIHILFRPLRQRELYCLGMQNEHQAHTICS